jgi:hypothetical protein
MLIFVCDVSPNEENEEIIMTVGKNILEIFNYDERQNIYYKSKQPIIREFTIPTLKNHTYKLNNHLYIKKVKNIMGENIDNTTINTSNIT